MNTRYSKEELIYSLPDYITRSINDKELIFEIERELELNPEFKSEHNELVKTFTFLESSELQNPPETYFNNLPVKINSRISEINHEENFWGKLGLFWKILIPALPVIIISVLLINFLKNENTVLSDFNNENEKTQEVQKENNSKSTNNEITKSDINNGQISEKPIQQIQNKDKIKSINKYTRKSRLSNADKEDVNAKLQLNNSDNVDQNATEEIAEDILYISEEDEEVEGLENEFFELTPEQQKDILAILKES